MSTVELEYTTSVDVSCGTCDGTAEVILCIPSYLVQIPECPDQDVQQVSERSYIEATLVSKTRVGSVCPGRSAIKYTFEYDSDQLIEGAILNANQINGFFCKNCLTQWIEDLVGNEPYIFTGNGDSKTFVSPHGCEYVIVEGDG